LGTTKKPDWIEETGVLADPALGFLELSSISRGLFITDSILKKAPVRVITSQPISSGKHVVLFFGDEASVEESYKEGVKEAGSYLLKKIFIPGVHPEIAPYLDSLWTQNAKSSEPDETVGIIETDSLAAAILSADQALKMADVHLCRMRLGQGIGGKAYFVLTGKQDEVEAAVEAAEQSLSRLESLVQKDIINRPTNEALVHF